MYEVNEEGRTTFIDEGIISLLPESVRDSARLRAKSIVKNYVGRDGDALSVLAYAAEKKRFDEFAGRLEIHYEESLSRVHPEARNVAGVPGASRATEFFLDCYQSMGIKPNLERSTLE
jgi:hypothetical protein